MTDPATGAKAAAKLWNLVPDCAGWGIEKGGVENGDAMLGAGPAREDDEDCAAALVLQPMRRVQRVVECDLPCDGRSLLVAVMRHPRLAADADGNDRDRSIVRLGRVR